MLRLMLPLFLSASVSAEMSSARIRTSVFSDRQLFWPELQGKSVAASLAPGKPESPAKGVSPVLIGVLPLRIKEYRESLPCDSCHRLSANGMEFFLENYLKDKLQHRFPGHQVELIAPHLPLLHPKMDLLAGLDSLALPWDRWFPDSQAFVYRPRDRFTRDPDRKRLDKLGGILGKTHLLLPVDLRVKVTPQASHTHQGGLEWGFALVLWNVAEGTPEWAMQYADQTGSMDLDASLAGRLDKALGQAWDGMPRELTALWKAEPR